MIAVGFCFTDRDFATSSPPITSFSFSEKEKEGKRKTAQGTAPRSEPRFAPADRDEIKSRGSMRLRPPRPPEERARRERQTTEMLCTAEKVSVFGQNLFARRSARHDSDLAFPSRGRCRRSRRMRCSAPARLCRQMLHFASLTEILSLRYRLSVFLSRRKKNSEKERPLRGFRREVSPDLLRRTEMKSKAWAQCGSAPRDPRGNGQAG